MKIGADIGSVSVDLAVIDDDGRVLDDIYLRHKGRPLETLAQGLEDLIDKHGLGNIDSLSVTGSGGKLAADILDCNFVNEIVSISASVGKFYPDVRTVVEIGGQDSKLIVVGLDENIGRTVIRDFAMNTICAAGTGSFLDQQASRLGLSVEELGDLALKSEKPPRIAGRCSVFAKSDMIHLQQEATPDYDIVAGLCFAMARNFKSTIAKGKKMGPEYCFMGGVALNKGMVRAFTEVLGLKEGELVIPEHITAMGAIGAAMTTAERDDAKPFRGLEKLYAYFERERRESQSHEQLKIGKEHFEPKASVVPLGENGSVVDAFLGIDVGSLSTNLVVMDKEYNILAKRYLMTAGRPIVAVRQGLEQIGEEIGDRVNIRGVGTTGSGRYLTADFVGGDIVRNEITAQATAAAFIDSKVDTIFEIGGQDSKYIALDGGAIVDFEMNKVCAAGTGSFIEEQAERLDIDVKKDFSGMALDAESPCSLGERCTVFIETDIVNQQQRGAERDDLAAGLSYSIVLNYLNRVVQEKKVGNHIFFQGGVAFNKGVVAAFETITGKAITVPDHHEVTGAWGMAIIAYQEWDGVSDSKFKGWDFSKREYKQSSFECTDCSNRCEIKVVEVEGEAPLYYGARCEKYEVDSAKKDMSHIPDLFKERDALLYAKYSDVKPKEGAPRVGILRALSSFELLPFYKTFFQELGCNVVLSDPSNKHIIHDGVESVAAESCFPIKVTHGHLLNLINKKVDYLFIPSVLTMFRENTRAENAYVCPYIQTIPYVLEGAFGLKEQGIKVLTPRLYFQEDRGWVKMQNELAKTGKELGFGKGKVKKALEKALQAQNEFTTKLRARGKEILESIPEDDNAVVIVSRPYNGCDRGINLEMPDKFRDLGVMAIPMDMLPVGEVELADEWDNMYWKYGVRILSAAEIIRNDKRLHGVYLTNFGCGPDSFILRFFRSKMGSKPFLQLEIDEHSADAGAVTRAEAFLDSVGNFRDKEHEGLDIALKSLTGDARERTIYIPNMADHAYALRAAFAANGLNAVVMDMPDEESLKLGRKYTTGKECYPAILTTGDMVKYINRPDFDPDSSMFFMAQGSGPCRFGQYNILQRIVLKELGHEDIPIFSPNQGSSLYHDLELAGANFTRLTWWGMVAIDILEKMLLQTRPYEVNEGQTWDIYWKYVQEIDRVIASGGELSEVVEVMEKAADEMKDIPVNWVPKPKIGVVGEIYVRTNRFANNFIIDSIEANGGEAVMPPLGEWFYYVNYTRKRENKANRGYKVLTKTLITEAVQKSDQKKLEKPFLGIARDLPDDPIEETINYGLKYVDTTIEGEAIITLGKAAELVDHLGCTGIANVMPFTCMPGTIVTSLFKKFSADYDDLPVLNMAYDGLEQANTQTRIEAFMHQAQQRMEAAMELAKK